MRRTAEAGTARARYWSLKHEVEVGRFPRYILLFVFLVIPQMEL